MQSDEDIYKSARPILTWGHPVLDVVEVLELVDLRVLDPLGVLAQAHADLDGEAEEEQAEEGQHAARHGEGGHQGLLC